MPNDDSRRHDRPPAHRPDSGPPPGQPHRMLSPEEAGFVFVTGNANAPQPRTAPPPAADPAPVEVATEGADAGDPAADSGASAARVPFRATAWGRPIQPQQSSENPVEASQPGEPVEEATPSVVAEPPPEAPTDTPDDPPTADTALEEAPAEPAKDEAPAAPVDLESYAARRHDTRRRPKPPTRSRPRFTRLTAAILALVAVNAALIFGRTKVVEVLPQTASLYGHLGLPVNLRNLAFKDIKTSEEDDNGTAILVIQGTIVATGREVVDVPRLRFAIRAANGHEIYAWTALPTRTKLAPGETLPFHTRLASPPEQGRTVAIRFFNRLDLASGLR